MIENADAPMGLVRSIMEVSSKLKVVGFDPNMNDLQPPRPCYSSSVYQIHTAVNNPSHQPTKPQQTPTSSPPLP